MKKITTLLTAITLMLSTGCGPTIYRNRHSSSTSEEPSISVISSSWNNSGVRYTVSATGYGALCSGNGYRDKSIAIGFPLEVYSAGYEIVVTLANENNIETVTMVAGDTKLIECAGLDDDDYGYLYVIIL